MNLKIRVIGLFIGYCASNNIKVCADACKKVCRGADREVCKKVFRGADLSYKPFYLLFEYFDKNESQVNRVSRSIDD